MSRHMSNNLVRLQQGRLMYRRDTFKLTSCWFARLLCLLAPNLTIFVGEPGFLGTVTLEGGQGEIFADAQGQDRLGNVIFNCFPAGSWLNCNNIIEFTNTKTPTFVQLPEFFDTVAGTGRGPIGPTSGMLAGVKGYFLAVATQAANVRLDLYFE